MPSPRARSVIAIARAEWQRALASARRREAATLLLALLPSLLVAPWLIAKVPLSHDHATHLFKAWHFWTELVPSGRLRGWSHFWGFGFPSDELVPCGGEVWVGLFRALTLGQLSWTQTYGVAFAGLMVFKCYAAYRLARCFFGPRVGVIAAYLTLLDRGGMLEGGWEWHTYWGVWPVTLSMAFAQLSLVRLERVLALGRARDLALGGVWFAAALLSHALPLVAFAVTVPLLFLDHRLRERPPPLLAYARALGALAFGAALAGFYLIPFFTLTAETMDLGWLHEPLPVIARRLLSGGTFQHQFYAVHALGLVGALVALRRRPPGGLFFATATLASVLLASDAMFRVLHLERAMPTLVKLEVNRLLVVAKIFFYPLAGYALVELFALLRRRARSVRARRALHALVAAAFAASLLTPGSRRLLVKVLSFPVTGKNDLEHWQDLRAFTRWSRAERARSREHYRIVYDFWRSDHLPTAMPVYDGTPMYKTGTTPAQIFDKLPMANDPELYGPLSVKYVVTATPKQAPKLRLAQRFGKLYVYEFTDYRPEPFTLLGPGRAELLEFSPERVRVALQGTGPDTRLTLHVASYPRWQAEQGGRALPITTVPVYRYKYPFLMQVPAGDGELVFAYVRRPAEWAGALLSLAALPGFWLALWLARRGAGRASRAAEWLEGHSRPLGWAALALVGGAAVAIAARTQTRARLLPKSSIFHHLTGPELTLAGQACQKERDLFFRCGPHTLQADLVSSQVWGTHLCMSAPPVGPLTLRAPLTLGSFIAGEYDAPKQGKGQIRFAIGGREVENFSTESPYLFKQAIRFDTREHRGTSPEIELTLTGVAANCFDFRLVD